MEEEKEKIVRYVLESTEQQKKEAFEEFMKKPLLYQKMTIGRMPSQYFGAMYVETDEKISYVNKRWSLRYGQNRYYIKASPNASGITYFKSGRSSSRANFWGGQFNNPQNSSNGMMYLCKKLNPKAAYLIDDKFIMNIMTKGMAGYILSGNIKTKSELMAYYIRYSLRGFGIKPENGLYLYHFMKTIDSTHKSKRLIQLSHDPNEFLESGKIYDNKFMGKLNNVTSSWKFPLDNMVLFNEKVDLINDDVAIKGIGFENKNDKLKKIYSYWTKGVKLEKRNRIKGPSNSDWEDMPF